MADSLLSITVQDIVGATKTIPVFFASTVTLAQIQGFLTAFAPFVNGIIDGIMTDARVELDLTLPGGLATEPAAGSTVRRGALFSYNNPSRFKWGMYLPAIDTDILVGTSVDLAASTVQEFVDAYVDGLTVSSVLIQPTNGSAEDLTALDHADETFRK